MIIIAVKKMADLYRQYPGQLRAQRCYVEIDCKHGTLSCSYDAEVGNAVPAYVYHGHAIRYGIPCLTPEAANGLMDAILPLAQRVEAGYTSDWDGDNMVGRYNEDATEALGIIEDMLRDIDYEDQIEAWDAGDWLGDVTHYYNRDGAHCRRENVEIVKIDCIGTITADTTDNEISEMVEKIEDELEPHQILDGTEKYLTEMRDQCKANMGDESCKNTD